MLNATFYLPLENLQNLPTLRNSSILLQQKLYKKFSGLFFNLTSLSGNRIS